MKQLGERIDFTFKGRVVDIQDCRKAGGPLMYKLKNQLDQEFWINDDYLQKAISDSNCNDRREGTQ
jgi:hypothetical protein